MRFYLFYLALINLGLDETMLKRINKFLFILFIIQLPAVAYRFSIYGISELTIGTYATHGGGPTADYSNCGSWIPGRIFFLLRTQDILCIIGCWFYFVWNCWCKANAIIYVSVIVYGDIFSGLYH